ncbi:MAG: metal ABC transporter substrate-binding protein [Lachnospiraceae bacterium]|nr:metal ABC transporter substrate-binding protein [Lachnospiraceae bacterium]
MKKINKMVLAGAVLCMTVLVGCAKERTTSLEKQETNQKINVVATIFPEYDFLRQIAGDKINLTMLLTPGAESHSFEPTPQNVKNVNNADLFVYVGGDSDAWVESILDSTAENSMKVITLMDCVEVVEEETVEGMTPEEEEEGKVETEPEYDEHVWTSPRNAQLIVQKLCNALSEVDPENAKVYQQNTTDYIKKLEQLDQSFQDVVNHSVRKEIIVGDRFPFRYFADAYGLTYYAAFPGCAADAEPSAQTIAFLTDKVKEDKIPVVFHIELSNEKVCNSICEASGAKSELLNAVHNISKEDFESGVTYLELMQKNVEVLKEALN